MTSKAASSESTFTVLDESGFAFGGGRVEVEVALAHEPPEKTIPNRFCEVLQDAGYLAVSPSGSSAAGLRATGDRPFGSGRK